MPYIRKQPPKKQSPKNNILKRIIKYLFFNFILTTSPVLINLFISFSNQIPYKNAILYCPDICFMTIVTGSSSIKDSYMSDTIKNNNFILGGVVTLNVIFMLLSAIIYANIAKDTLASNNDENITITIQQFIISIVCYIVSLALGLGIQIGGGIDE